MTYISDIERQGITYRVDLIDTVTEFLSGHHIESGWKVYYITLFLQPQRSFPKT